MDEQRSSQRGLRAPEGFILHEETGDRFNIPMEDIPDGMKYQWERLTYLGKVDSRHQANLAMNRWVPVPLTRHPDYGSDSALIDGQKNGKLGKETHIWDQCIIRDGMILMERPKEIDDYVRAVSKQKADAQVLQQMARNKMAPEGTLAGVNRQRNATFNRTRDLSIPEDAE
jgi:hypothetical protein